MYGILKKSVCGIIGDPRGDPNPATDALFFSRIIFAAIRTLVDMHHKHGKYLFTLLQTTKTLNCGLAYEF